jgi:uncharacterized damage-inducible protein DinB
MELKRFFLEQLEREAASTRKVLERVPEGQNNWRPHERSMELGHLAAMIAAMPGWAALMIDCDELDLDDPANAGLKTTPVADRAELLERLNKSLLAGRKALEGTTEEHLLKPWCFVYGGHVLSEQPRYIVLSDTLFSHLAHHRGQLTVYLRLNEAKVPALYGPSADEQ